MNEYPKAVYPMGTFHPDDRDANGQVADFRVVQSAEEEADAKADGYYAFGEAPEGKDELSSLRAEAATRGIAIKGNWGVKKLREVLEV